MRLLPNLREYRKPTMRLPDKLPYTYPVAPGVVLLKRAALMKTVRYRPHDLGSAGVIERKHAAAAFNNALHRLKGGWGLHDEAARRQANHFPQTRWPHPVLTLIDCERKDLYESQPHFESSYHLTFTWGMPSDNEKRLERFIYEEAPGSSTNAAFQRDLAYFQQQVSDIVSLMGEAFRDVEELDDEETLTYLHSCISTNPHKVAVPETLIPLDAYLPDQPYTAADTAMLGDHFMPTVTVTGFPGKGLPLLLEDLNAAGIEYRWVSRFIFLDREQAEEEIKKYKVSWFKKRQDVRSLLGGIVTQQEHSQRDDDGALDQRDDAAAALRVLSTGQVAFGYLTMTITTWDRDLARAREKMVELKRCVQARGCTVIDETLNACEAWLGSLPGEFEANVRRPFMHTFNLAHLMPLSAPWTGDEENAHLKSITTPPVGAPHIYCSSGAAPFRLNLNMGDVGHTFIAGPTGAGKSTLLTMLAMQWLKYPKAQVIYFDKGLSARAATLALGGSVYEPGRDDASPAFQPLASLQDRRDRAFAAELLATMLELQGIELDVEVRKAIDGTLTSLAKLPLELRTLTEAAGLLRTHRRVLGDALQPYTKAGAHGQIFDAAHDDLREDSWTLVEMGHLLKRGEAVSIPALQYLFHRLEQRFDGRPTLLIIDESWVVFAHRYWAARLEEWLKTLRKKRVFVVFATQEPEDVLKQADLVASVLSNCATTIFLPDPTIAGSERRANAYRQFGLADRDLEVLGDGQQKRDYYACTKGRGRRVFQLDLGPVALTFAGMSGEEDQKFLDTVAAQKPTRPTERAERLLRHRGLGWAADALRGQDPHKNTERRVA